mmetsp:Transcript_22690/g.58019  ORF Transcript_22690/g.58019 Transcript_22690/m.58019 type:complete len:226 (-) Transcript_22690:331-1008(-)
MMLGSGLLENLPHHNANMEFGGQSTLKELVLQSLKRLFSNLVQYTSDLLRNVSVLGGPHLGNPGRCRWSRRLHGGLRLEPAGRQGVLVRLTAPLWALALPLPVPRRRSKPRGCLFSPTATSPPVPAARPPAVLLHAEPIRNLVVVWLRVAHVQVAELEQEIKRVALALNLVGYLTVLGPPSVPPAHALLRWFILHLVRLIPVAVVFIIRILESILRVHSYAWCWC